MVERSHPDFGSQLLEMLRRSRLVTALRAWLKGPDRPDPDEKTDIAWEDGEPRDRGPEPR